MPRPTQREYLSSKLGKLDSVLCRHYVIVCWLNKFNILKFFCFFLFFYYFFLNKKTDHLG